MGVYIKDMEMPKECGPHEITITLFVRDDGTASLWGKEVFIPHEPLEVVAVPPHGRLIDADALKKKRHWTDDFYETEYVEVEDIDDASTVIEAEEATDGKQD